VDFLNRNWSVIIDGDELMEFTNVVGSKNVIEVNKTSKHNWIWIVVNVSEETKMVCKLRFKLMEVTPMGVNIKTSN
jgi:hypothetical protein